MFFALLLSFSRERQISRNSSMRRSPQLVPVTPPGGDGSRCPPARAVVRAATATKHEPGLSPSYRVVSYGPALEFWVLLMRNVSSPACTQRSISRAAASASRPDPLALSGDERGCSKAFIRCAQRNSQHRSRTSQLFLLLRADKVPPNRPQKTFSRLVAATPLVDSCMRGARYFCSPEDADAQARLCSQNASL